MSTVFNIILLMKPAADMSRDMKPCPTVNRHQSTPYHITASHATKHSTNAKNRLMTTPCSKIQQFQKSGTWPKPSGRIYCAQTVATLHTVSLGCYSEVMGHMMMPR